MQNWIVRPAVIGDLDRVVAAAHATQQFHYERAPDQFLPPDENAIVDFVAAAIEDENKEVLVAVDEADSVQGYALVLIQRRDPNPFTPFSVIVEIDQLGVLPSAEGRGAGTALTKRAVEIAGEHNADSLRLTVWTFNDRAISLYEQNGFETTLLNMRHTSIAARKGA